MAVKTYRVHKTRGTCRVVNVEATHYRFIDGVALFYIVGKHWS